MASNGASAHSGHTYSTALLQVHVAVPANWEWRASGTQYGVPKQLCTATCCVHSSSTQFSICVQTALSVHLRKVNPSPCLLPAASGISLCCLCFAWHLQLPIPILLQLCLTSGLQSHSLSAELHCWHNDMLDLHHLLWYTAWFNVVYLRS